MSADHMNCPKCGATIQGGFRFCPHCGSSIETAQNVCRGCGYSAPHGMNFCPDCGLSLRAVPQERARKTFEQQAPVSHSREIAPGEVLLKDTGLFPIVYSKSAFRSINGKLHLTNRRLLFTASRLQGIGGVAVEGMYIPNPADADKSDEYLSIPLVEITRVESGRASLTVHVADKKYKFGGMRETSKWAGAVTNAIRKYGTRSRRLDRDRS